MLPNNSNFAHSYRHHICRFVHSAKLSFDNFYNTFYIKHKDTIELKTKWEYHWSHIADFPPVSRQNILFILYKYYPSLRNSKSKRVFTEQFILNPDHILKVPILTQNEFNLDEKFIIINTPMGSGKTAQTTDKLLGVSSFCWMIPTIALARNTYFRMVEKNIDCCYYKDKKLFKKQSDKENLRKYEKLIICANSLHYIQDKIYEVVVVDEIESFLINWHNNSTFNDKTDTKHECL